MKPVFEKNKFQQAALIGAFVTAGLGLGAVCVLFAAPVSLVLLLLLPLVWVALRRSRKLSLTLAAWVSACAIFAAVWWYPQNLLDNALGLLSGAGLYTAALFLIDYFQKERVQADGEALKKEESAARSYRAVAMYAPHFEFWIKPDGNFAYVSPACKRVIGCTATELLQNPARLFELIQREDRSRVFFELTREKKKNEESRPFEFVLLLSEGNLRNIEMQCHQIYDESGEYLGKRGTAEDVSEQRRAVQTLQNRLERLTLALEGANEGMWDFDLVQGQMAFNHSYARSLGISETITSISMQEFYARVHPDDKTLIIEALKNHLQGKTAYYEAEYRLKGEGGWRWVLDRGRVAERDLGGKAVRVVGVHIDMSERKQIEEALRQSEMKFRQVAENMREVFWLRDRNSRKFIFVSSGFSEIWGQSAEALYDNPNLFIESIHPDDLSRVFAAQKDLFEMARDMHEEFRVVHSSGSVHWVWSRAYPIYDEAGRYYRIAGFVEDITERKNADLSLQESEKRYRDLIEQQGGGVGIFDPADKVIYINPAGEEIFGVPHGSLAGRNLKEFLSDDQLNILMGQAALRRQGVESSYELTITRPDEERRSLLFTATPRFDANNQFLGNIIIFRDISQRKVKEERLLYVSQHDTLTGLYNRSVFEDEVNRLDQGIFWPVGIIMVDADGLKIINDQMGHARGDELLIRISSILKSSVRDSDIVARVGGDEFAIVLPSADALSLQHVMDRIFEQVEDENRKPDTPFTISLSAGGMVCNQKGGLRETIKEADARMYQVKAQKKNQLFLNLPIIGRKKL
ncbi:MAG: PAS domain S-box protein [Anaerolineae bacterium]|nr:PAS domain S-box protein [Anaerolineae bacterium]